MNDANHLTSNLHLCLPDPVRAYAKVKQEPDVLGIIGPVISALLDDFFRVTAAKVPNL